MERGEEVVMKIAIVHYHLRGGGVTRVISHAAQALTNAGHQVAVITGEKPQCDGMPLPQWCVIAELGYAVSQSSATTPVGEEAMAVKVTKAARNILGGPPDLWHFHNHSLGKNLVMPLLVHYMAEHGYPLLLQLHDFAEDGRPRNYRYLTDGLATGNVAALGSILYPQGEHIHYATLNCRDHGFLCSAGTAKEQLHLLPNAIHFDKRPAFHSRSPERARRQGGDRLVVYPTRAIRRKNLGEFILWSALEPDNTRWAVTLAPRNPVARPVYERWVNFTVEAGLPVEFEYGPHCGLPFAELLQRADAAFTTSVAEGFGLVFLEPWLLGTPVYGRDLPEITGEFVETGLDLQHLYERLEVPVEWVALERFRNCVECAARESFAQYGQTLPYDFVDRVVAAAVRGGTVDFGRLDEPMQELVIERVTASEQASSEIIPAAMPPLEQVQRKCFDNGDTVRNEYSLARFGQRLLRAYTKVAASSHAPRPPLEAQELLDKFLAPERFSLLRAGR